MSAPTTHDPLVVNTTDGVTWLRRAVTQDRRGLYAVTDSCKCPEYLMATLTELEGHGIAGSADALPMPVGPEPQAPAGHAELAELRAHGEFLMRDVKRLRARVAELEAAAYGDAEVRLLAPVEQIRHLHQAVAAQMSRAGTLDRLLREAQARLTEPEKPTSSGRCGKSLSTGKPCPDHPVSYPPALPWAGLLDDEDRDEFLADLTASIVGYDGAAALAEVEKACATWRLIAEAQHAHNTAPGPSVEESADALTRLLAPTQALREDDPNGLHHEYRVSRDLPESGGVRDV